MRGFAFSIKGVILIGGVWAARCIVEAQISGASFRLSFSASSWPRLVDFTWLSGLLRPPRSLLVLLLQKPGILRSGAGCKVTCMGEREIFDLSLRLGNLSLRVRSSPSGSLISAPDPLPTSPSSRGSFEVVVPESEAPLDCPPLVRRARRSSSALSSGSRPLVSSLRFPQRL